MKKNQKQKKEINYMGLVKRAFNITKSHKFLWILGILVAMGSGGSGNFNISDFSSDESEQTTEAISEVAQDMLAFLQDNWGLVTAVGLLFLIIIIAIKVLSLIARGGLIDAVDKIDSDMETGFKKSFKQGAGFFWSLFALGLFKFMVTLALAAAIIIPFFLLITTFAITELSAVSIILGIILLFIGLFLLIIPLIFIGILIHFATFYVVVAKQKFASSLSLAYNLIKNNIWPIILAGLVSFGISILFTLGLILLMIPVFIIITLMVVGTIALEQNLLLVISAIILGIIFILASLLISGIFTAFKLAYWTLFFKEIATEKIDNKTKKEQEEEEQAKLKEKPKPSEAPVA
ncbi:MAG: hypothetical protein GF335_02015 [Candidatus Moranbacteria bacterium]|nr:hypothetical protein [Candidatus Moranbacteria bacterium]